MNRLAVMLRLIDFIAAGSATGSQMSRLARDQGIPPGEPSIVFLTEIKSVFRELPDRIYPDRSTRLSLMDAVQDALDEAIEQEEGEVKE
jgi:type III secretion system TyeA family effector delivery regulator